MFSMFHLLEMRNSLSEVEDTINRIGKVSEVFDEVVVVTADNTEHNVLLKDLKWLPFVGDKVRIKIFKNDFHEREFLTCFRFASVETSTKIRSAIQERWK